MDSEDEPVYQYYTIVSSSDTFITGVEDDSLTFVEGESPDKVMYLSLKEEAEQEEGYAPEMVLNGGTEPADDDEDSMAVANIELIATEDGQMFMTDPMIFPGAAMLKQEESDAPQDDDDSKNEEQADDNESDYRKIQLEDGSCAYIEKSLWQSIMGTVVEEDGGEEVAVKVKKRRTAATSVKKEKRYRCTYFGCDKVYTTAHHLTVHMRNHTGSRPYQCTVESCEKSFSTGYSLKSHLRTHTGEAPYCCSRCPKQFKTSGDLQKHMRTHTGEKPFKCPIEGCGRSFTTSNIRKVHIRSHTGERPYACTFAECGKAFASTTNFKNHMRIHSGEKPYHCNIPGCGKRFTEYSSLFKHNTVHKPFKALKCEYCDQLCKHETTLKAHKQAMHKVLIADDGTEIHLTKEKYGEYFTVSNSS